MAIPLKQSTASQEVILGPFLDDSDGKTAESGLTIANTDLKVWKAGGTSEASKNSGGATHIAAGRYYAVLDATDTDTLGPLVISCHVAGALPVRLECWVLPANVYDSLFGSDKLQVDVVETATGVIDADAVAADAVTEIQSGLATAAALSTLSGYVDTEVGAIYSGVQAIQAKTDALPTDPADASDIAAAFSAVNNSLATIAGYLDTEVGAIKAKTDNLPTDPADQSAVEAAITAAQSAITMAIAALNNLSQAQAQTAAAAALTAYDPPTRAEATADKDEVLAALPAAAPTANQNADALLDRASAVDGYTVRQLLRLVGAALVGEVSGAGTTTVVFRAADDSKARITATVTADGDRSALTLDAS